MWLQMVTVISTFAGCGGSSLGYKWSGFKELLAVEWETNAVETFKLNFPEVPVWQRDICSVTAQEIFDFTGIKKGELDVLDGSPPCQGFSTAGKRKVNDSRNDLFKEYVRLVNDLQPKVFIMENVSGMIKGKMKGKFIEIMQTLKSLNYQVKCKLLNAMWYEVPQSRERLFFIGVRNDLNKQPEFPVPLKSFITVKQALNNVENKNFDPQLKRFENLYSYIKQGKAIIHCCPKELILKFAPRFINNPKLKIQNFGYRMINNKPAPTIIKLETNTSTKHIHPFENRKCTIEEIKRLSSFPDEYKFTGKFEQQWARIGNAVMPKQMYHIAKTIKENILTKNGSPFKLK